MPDKYTFSCKCETNGKLYSGNNSVHYLSNWLINTGRMEAYPRGFACCPEGRPIDANELRTKFLMKNFKSYAGAKKTPAYIYCFDEQKNPHIYLGTETFAVVGWLPYEVTSQEYYR